MNVFLLYALISLGAAKIARSEGTFTAAESTAAPSAMAINVPKIVIEQPAGVPLVSGMGTVVARGSNYWGQCNVPEGLKGVQAIAAGWGHSVALKSDGTVVAWGINDFAQQSTVPKGLAGVTAIAAGGDSTVSLRVSTGSVPHVVSVWGYQEYGLTHVPSDLPDVTAVSAGYNHIVTLLANGKVRAWGDNIAGQLKIPPTLAGIVEIAAGGDHTLAMNAAGKVFAWGANSDGECRVPPSLNRVQALAAGRRHSMALLETGRVVAWGSNSDGQISIPRGLEGVVEIAAGNEHSVALRRDGTVAAWGALRDVELPNAVQNIASGSYHILGLRKAVRIDNFQVFDERIQELVIKNTGSAPLTIKSMTVSGRDANPFRIVSRLTTLPAPTPPAASTQGKILLDFFPKIGGWKEALLTVTTDDPDPSRNPFKIPLEAYVEPQKAMRTGPDGDNFIYTPICVDRQTGLMVQTVSFRNTGDELPFGFSLQLQGLPVGVTAFSSSQGPSGIIEILYANRLAAGATAELELVYFDPKRRTSWQPILSVVGLNEKTVQPGEVAGKLVTVRSVKISSQGAVVDFDCSPDSVFVVEYSDDAQISWHAAVHRLVGGGTRMIWVDRGPPETQTKALGSPQKPGGRFYRVKRLSTAL